MEKLKLWLQLLSTPELGRKKIRRLLNLFGNPENFIGQRKTEINDLAYLTEEQKKHLSKFDLTANWNTISKCFKKLDIRYITILNKDYPPYLQSIYDPPVIIFYRGDLGSFTQKRTIALVGTRRPSNYGKLMAEKISSNLAEAGFTIVSGLAYGIDSIAHSSALNKGKKTVAVMATGVDMIYPPGNQNLSEKIIRNGAILSEYIPGSKAEKWYFPTRNRIISGLCAGTIVIEGSRKSGALLTAKFALDQNRDVFALPGDINRKQAEGPNYLIKMGAKPVTEICDILEEYDVQLSNDEISFPELNKLEKEIFQMIITSKPEINFDKLILKSGLDVNSLSSILLSLELKSLVKKVEGNRYIVI